MASADPDTYVLAGPISVGLVAVVAGFGAWWTYFELGGRMGCTGILAEMAIM